MKTSRMLPPSKFISKHDIGDREYTLRIRGVQVEQVGASQTDTKWVLYFDGAAKGLPLNTGAIRTLEAAFGDDSDFWTGQQVILWVDPSVTFQGRTVGGVRIRALKAPGAAIPAAAAATFAMTQPAPVQPLGLSAGRVPAPSALDPDDAIPF